MKAITIIITTFLIAFATTTLLDLIFINSNPVRYFLVVLLVVVELLSGFIYLFHELKNLKNLK